MAGSTRTDRDVLVFDGDCRFCSSIARWVAKRLPEGAGTLPYQFLEDPSSHGLTPDDVSSAAYWIDRRGRPHRGHLAAAETLVRIGGGWRLVGRAIRVPPLSWVVAGAYELISRNRHRLPGGTPACRIDPPR